MAEFATALAGRVHRATEVLHALVYFVPEADEELAAVGLNKGRMTYFASRSAPMGAVSATVTAATFYNFNPAHIAKYIPLAWSLATPEQIIDARLKVVDRAYRRLLSAETEAIAELAGLVRDATTDLRLECRPLYAGHASLAWPDEAHLVLWHGVTLLREYRGDGHLVALLDAGLSGIESIVTHTATGRGFVEEVGRKLRGWSEEEWSAAKDALRGRGLMDGDGLSADGVALRASIEDATDRLDRAAWLRPGEERTTRVIELGKHLSRTALMAGAIPPGVFAG